MSGATFQRELNLIGRSEAMRAIQADIECAARTDAKVLVTGETGVGKEVVSRLIHRRSARRSAMMMTLNCAGLPDSLLESELFGHARGSFTGAYRDKPGLLELAPGGTVFLDEVGDMSPRMQVVLLRFLESGEIQRVGANRPHICANVRLITATNRDLAVRIASGAFREDLYFRLNVIRVTIPPLRERTEDIPLLVAHFLEAYSLVHRVPVLQVSPAALETLIAYRWPGNVRELKNVVERMVLKTIGSTVRPSDLPADLVQPRARTGGEDVIDTGRHTSIAEESVNTMIQGGESFWTTVYAPFMARDLTRHALRKIVRLGLEQTNGNYKLLVQVFNIAPHDYKRFLSFLRKHDCHLPFQQFRAAPGHARVTHASDVVVRH